MKRNNLRHDKYLAEESLYLIEKPVGFYSREHSQRNLAFIIEGAYFQGNLISSGGFISAVY